MNFEKRLPLCKLFQHKQGILIRKTLFWLGFIFFCLFEQNRWILAFRSGRWGLRGFNMFVDVWIGLVEFFGFLTLLPLGTLSILFLNLIYLYLTSIRSKSILIRLLRKFLLFYFRDKLRNRIFYSATVALIYNYLPQRYFPTFFSLFSIVNSFLWFDFTP